MTEKLYVVQALQAWSDLKLQAPMQVLQLKPADGLGDFFLPVFRSYEQAHAEYPNSQIAVVYRVEPAESEVRDLSELEAKPTRM